MLPWTHRHSESPDLFPESPDSDPALATRDREEMEAIIVPAIAMSSRVVMGRSARWRDEHLLRKPCGESSVAQKCPHSCDCMTFALPGQPISGAVFQRFGMWPGLCEMAWDPVHIPLARDPLLGERDGWGEMYDLSEEMIEEVTRARAPPGALAGPHAPLPCRTDFTTHAIKAGLPWELQYMQVGDVVIWRDEPHFVHTLTGGTILFRRPDQHNISVRELEAFDEHDMRPHMASYGSVYKNGICCSYVKAGGEFGLGEAITTKELHVASKSDVALAKEAAAAAAL